MYISDPLKLPLLPKSVHFTWDLSVWLFFFFYVISESMAIFIARLRKGKSGHSLDSYSITAIKFNNRNYLRSFTLIFSKNSSTISWWDILEKMYFVSKSIVGLLRAVQSTSICLKVIFVFYMISYLRGSSAFLQYSILCIRSVRVWIQRRSEGSAFLFVTGLN